MVLGLQRTRQIVLVTFLATLAGQLQWRWHDSTSVFPCLWYRHTTAGWRFRGSDFQRLVRRLTRRSTLAGSSGVVKIWVVA